MKKLLVLALIGALMAVVVGIFVTPVPEASVDFRETRWYELRPNGWDPDQQLRDMRREIQSLSDADPRAAAMLAKMRELWNDAPTNPALDGAAVRIPGYLVPLDQNEAGISEFLLVPYFGACIHSPPPPSNQIVHVRPRRALVGMRAMEPVWVSGTLRALRSDSAMGTSGYGMDAARVEPYSAVVMP